MNLIKLGRFYSLNLAEPKVSMHERDIVRDMPALLKADVRRPLKIRTAVEPM